MKRDNAGCSWEQMHSGGAALERKDSKWPERRNERADEGTEGEHGV